VVLLSNDTQGETGGSVLMACSGYSEPHDSSTISWMKGDQEVANTSTVTITEETTVQNGRRLRTSYLSICSLQFSDSGGYTCVVSSEDQVRNATTTLSIPGEFLIY